MFLKWSIIADHDDDDGDCSQSIQSLERSILGFPMASHFSSSVRIRCRTATLQTLLPLNCQTQCNALLVQVQCNSEHQIAFEFLVKCNSSKPRAKSQWKAVKCIAASPDMGMQFNWSQHPPSWSTIGKFSISWFLTHFCSAQTPHVPNWCRDQNTIEMTKDLKTLSARFYWLVSKASLAKCGMILHKVVFSKEWLKRNF